MEAGDPVRCNRGLKEARYRRHDRPGGRRDALWDLRGRPRIAGIAFCLEEMTGKEVVGGHVEYIPDGISRYHTVQPRDRRQLLTTLHKLRAIHRGEAPVHPLNAPCNRCKYKERCEDSGGHRLSELL